MSVKLIAAGLVVGLHLAVLGLVLAAPEVAPQVQPSDAGDMQMVEISMESPAGAPGLAPAPLPAEAPPEMIPEPPEPVVDTSAVETEKPPVTVLRAEKKAAPPPKQLKHERKPDHKSRPKPVLKAALRSTSTKTEIEPSGAAISAAKTVANASPSTSSRPSQPDRPRLIGRVDYLGGRPIPVYPRLSERRGEQGRVIVRVSISAQGSVVGVSVRTSSGYSRLDSAALDAARSARFKPYTENGVAYAAMVDIPFDFVL
ncbi:MAG: energy transducer TonB [Paralcaligenes sp.]